MLEDAAGFEMQEGAKGVMMHLALGAGKTRTGLLSKSPGGRVALPTLGCGSAKPISDF